ncbi:MAG TPA: esterase [Chthoniobacterales bacterium]|nr:esterase [Chthoniobacterales bacterium]
MKLLVSLVLAFVSASSTALAAEPAPMKWTVDAVQREALVFLPSTSTKAKAPVIFSFHGHGGNMHFAARGMGFQNFWPEAIVVYPQGLPTPGLIMDEKGEKPGWQREPGKQQDRDLKFVDAILATLREKYSMDERRIYATGFSNGGLFTYLLWAARGNVFTAFAPGGAVLLPSVQPTQPRPILHYGGERDRIARFANQQRTIEQIRTFNGCAAQGQSCGASCTLYSSSKGAPVETFIHPFGHIYPPPVTTVIVKFFQEHPRIP